MPTLLLGFSTGLGLADRYGAVWNSPRVVKDTGSWMTGRSRRPPLVRGHGNWPQADPLLLTTRAEGGATGLSSQAVRELGPPLARGGTTAGCWAGVLVLVLVLVPALVPVLVPVLVLGCSAGFLPTVPARQGRR